MSFLAAPVARPALCARLPVGLALPHRARQPLPPPPPPRSPPLGRMPLVTDRPRTRGSIIGQRVGRSTARRRRRSRAPSAAGALAVVARWMHWPPRRAAAPAADAVTAVPPRGQPASEPPVGNAPRERHARGPLTPIGDDARGTRRAQSARGRGLVCAGRRRRARPPCARPSVAHAAAATASAPAPGRNRE